MIRFNLQLLPENPADNEVYKSNAAAEHSCIHVTSLVGALKCRKHPSFKNVINIIAKKGEDPKAEIISVCCPEFYARIG